MRYSITFDAEADYDAILTDVAKLLRKPYVSTFKFESVARPETNLSIHDLKAAGPNVVPFPGGGAA